MMLYRSCIVVLVISRFSSMSWKMTLLLSNTASKRRFSHKCLVLGRMDPERLSKVLTQKERTRRLNT
jgi:hypothetical protein